MKDLKNFITETASAMNKLSKQKFIDNISSGKLLYIFGGKVKKNTSDQELIDFFDSYVLTGDEDVKTVKSASSRKITFSNNSTLGFFQQAKYSFYEYKDFYICQLVYDDGSKYITIYKLV